MKKPSLVVLLLLAGCTPTQLTKPGVTQAEFDRDLAQCKYEADLALQGIRDAFERVLRRNDLAEECMKVRGYVAAK